MTSSFTEKILDKVQDHSESWDSLPHNIRKEIKDNITTIVQKYKGISKKGNVEKFSEEDVKIKFLNPLLETLGWEVRGIDEVKFEQPTLTGRTDFGLKPSPESRPAVFYELKSFSESLDGYRKRRGEKKSYPEIAIEDAWQMKVDWAVLTNFKEFRLYQTHVKKPSDGLVFSIKFNELLKEESLQKLWDLSKGRIKSGSLESYERRRERNNITTEIINNLYSIRKELGEEINRNNDLNKEDLRESVQRILDRLVVIRTAEDRGIINPESLDRIVNAWEDTTIDKSIRTLMQDLKNLFRDFDSVYNSKLFAEHFCEDLEIGNEIIRKTIDGLYNYNFDLIDADILGSIYEDYLGHALEEKEEDLDIVESYSSRKEEGIYYTPIPIVQYCVKESVGKKVGQADTPNQISGINILDPACGSGSFLIKAYDFFKNWYEKYDEKAHEEAKERGDLIGYEKLTQKAGIKIIEENLFGVDKDHQSVEIASVNLMLKGLKKDQKMPMIMGKSFKQGNSLISDSKYSKNAMMWGEEFSDIMDQGGFDVVVGNPPWGADIGKYEDFLEENYPLAKGQYDSFELFIDLSRKILREGGIWGFVIPDSLFKPEHWRVRKFLSEENKILKIIKLGEGFFEGVYRSAVIIIFQKEDPPESHSLDVTILRKKDRKKIKDGVSTISEIEKEKGYQVPQKRFREDDNYEFDISISEKDEKIIEKMNESSINWNKLFKSGRGIEFSQSGEVIRCPNCFKWDNPPAKRKGEYKEKECTHCGHEYSYKNAVAKDVIVQNNKKNEDYERFAKGESVNRYYLTDLKYVDTSKDGINYKDRDLYDGKKILIRKTGVGIYATIGEETTYVPQAVYIFNYDPQSEEYSNYDPEYVLGVLTSRLMLYYYYKDFGEIEWKSFPYLTLTKIKELPVKKIDFSDDREKELHDEISRKVSEILEKSKNGETPSELDWEVEQKVMELYGINEEMKNHIWEELDKVQDLRIIRETMNKN